MGSITLARQQNEENNLFVGESHTEELQGLALMLLYRMDGDIHIVGDLIVLHTLEISHFEYHTAFFWQLLDLGIDLLHQLRLDHLVDDEVLPFFLFEVHKLFTG